MIVKKLIGCSALAVLVCSASVCRAELIGHWSFDEADGATAAESVSGHDATLLGDAAFAPGAGPFGGALLLPNPINPDLRTSRAEFAFDEVFDTETYSISIWFNTDQQTNGHFGLSGNRNIANGHTDGRGWCNEINAYNNYGLRALIPSGSDFDDVRTEWMAELGVWHMATWVIDGTTQKARAYANGELVQVYEGHGGQGNLVDEYSMRGPDSLFRAGHFWIGGSGVNGKELFVGMLDDMGIWNHALTAEEVAEVYANGVVAAPMTWDGADGDWGAIVDGHSHWSADSTDLPSIDMKALVDTGICTVPAGYTTAEAKILDVEGDATVNIAATGELTVAEEMAVAGTATVNVDGTLTAFSLTTADGTTLNVDGTLSADSLTTDPGSTLAGSGTIAAGEVMLGGIVAPGNSIGVLTLDASGGGSELIDSAVYRCEIGADDAPITNDVIDVTAGDLALGGTLELVATSKLRGPDESGQWFGEQTRRITNAAGDNSVGFYFSTPPTPLPADFGTAEWGEGHIGRGVFLTRDNSGGENDAPGVSYAFDGTDVHLFQAIDGDTNGNAILDTADIFSILGAGSFLKPGEWDWTEGDFDGDQDVDTTDIFAILATGKWGNFAPYYPEPGKASAAKGEADAVVDLIVNAATGEVSVDTNGAEITGYVISSDSGALTGSAATQFALSEQTSDQIADMLPLGKAFAGVHDLGSVLQGDGSDLTLTYTLADQAGVFTGNVKVVPEPGTLLMLLGGAMSLLLAVVRRRRNV